VPGSESVSAPPLKAFARVDTLRVASRGKLTIATHAVTPCSRPLSPRAYTD
jgi:hypothetical protein